MKKKDLKLPIHLSSCYSSQSPEDAESIYSQNFASPLEAYKNSGTMIYNRVNHPNAIEAEDKIAQISGTENCLLFNSGMSAINTIFMGFLSKGSKLLVSYPCYGCSYKLISGVLTKFGIEVDYFKNGEVPDNDKKYDMVYIESPSNPLISLSDISAIIKKEKAKNPYLISVVDNTFLGPYWQNAHELGADISVYSATKYLSGHSDLIAGAVTGSFELLSPLSVYRAIMGSMIGSFPAWQLSRSLETYEIRCQRQELVAREIFHFFDKHPLVAKVYYPMSGKNKYLYEKLCSGPGAMISIELKADKKAVFEFLRSLKVFTLSVSLGCVKSLVQHPYTMTHAVLDESEKKKANINDNLIRFSIGMEEPEKLKEDLSQAFEILKNFRK